MGHQPQMISNPNTDKPRRWTGHLNGTYQNWAEPSETDFPFSRGALLCAAINSISGKWAAKPCSDTYGTVCKIAAQSEQQYATRPSAVSTNSPLSPTQLLRLEQPVANVKPKQTDGGTGGVSPETAAVIIILVLLIIALIAVAVTLSVRHREQLNCCSWFSSPVNELRQVDVHEMATEL